MKAAVRIRLATLADASAIDSIYEPYVRTSTCTFQNEPDPPGTREAWLRAHDEKHPVTVAEKDGEIVGWGALSTFRDRWGYRFTVENSVYVRQDLHGLGIGSTILADSIERAEALGHRTIIAGISADQTASLRLHERFEFREVARLHDVGHKLGRWLDVVFLQRMLGSISIWD